MATSAATAALPKPAEGGGKSKLKFMAVVVLLTLLAAGTGGVLGIQLVGTVQEAVKARSAAEEQPAEPRYGGPTHLKPLAPIVTNVAEPSNAWVRVEASIVFEEEAVATDDVLAAEITEDLLAFLRTVSLAQIAGASGMQHLREDLSERARIRSQGRVKELVIQSLVIE
jgi:flagellar FliL protein